MKIEDIKKASKLQDTLNSIDKALKHVPVYRTELMARVKREGTRRPEDVIGVTSGEQLGWASITSIDNQSINFTGCYIGAELIDAAEEILRKKRADVLKALADIGVTVEETVTP